MIMLFKHPITATRGVNGYLKNPTLVHIQVRLWGFLSEKLMADVKTNP